MDIARISQILKSCLADEGDSGVDMVDVWMHVPLNVQLVKEYELEMQTLLEEWPRESEGRSALLGDELSYLQVGAVLGDNQLAFMLFAFGKVLGWWKVMTPTTLQGLPKDDPRAQSMAKMGFVAIAGYTPAGVMP